MSVKPIPDGYRTITPCIVVENGLEALGFYERAFGAEVRLKLVMGGKLMHSELQIGDSIVSVIDELERRGFVARQRSESDRRRSVVSLTEAGLEILERADALGRELIDGLDSEAREIVVDALSRSYKTPG